MRRSACRGEPEDGKLIGSDCSRTNLYLQTISYCQVILQLRGFCVSVEEADCRRTVMCVMRAIKGATSCIKRRRVSSHKKCFRETEPYRQLNQAVFKSQFHSTLGSLCKSGPFSSLQGRLTNPLSPKNYPHNKMRLHALVAFITSITAVSAAALPADASLEVEAREDGGSTIVSRAACQPGTTGWVWTDSSHTQCRWLFCQGIQNPQFVTWFICPVGATCQYVNGVPGCV
jgi:hypothetical protein